MILFFKLVNEIIALGQKCEQVVAELSQPSECEKAIAEINQKFGVDMPILSAVYHIIYEKISPAIEMKLLAEKLA